MLIINGTVLLFDHDTQPKKIIYINKKVKKNNPKAVWVNLYYS